MGIVVRPAVPGDAPGLVATHVRSWQAAYQPFFSPDYLASLSEETESRIERWERIIASPDEEGSTTFVAVEDGRLTGFL
ncbi:MAG: GNAT family N-acetyltransferase, partial [Acidimicrobiales bacterium]